MRQRTSSRGAPLAVALVATVAGLLRAPTAPAGEPPLVVPAARGAVDVYERNKASLEAILVHVAKDLKVRAASWPPRGGVGPGAVLVLVVDPTTSLQPEMLELRQALVAAMREGPTGMRVGVLGAGAEYQPPGSLEDARGALTALHALPLDGPKNLLEGVREAVADLRTPATEPRAVLLVTREGGDAEDDVEATRSLLVERGVAFYSAAPEAAFERPWEYDFKPREAPDLGITQRFTPLPRRRTKGELYYGGEVPFGLVPYRWELLAFPFAQTEFDWAGPGRFPCPSGFGYWPLATLSSSTGGRCFVFNFRAPGARSKADDRHVELYDLGFLNLFAPDLRPRAEVLRALEESRKALAIVRVWDHLADETAPLVLDLATLERSGGGLSVRPMGPVRSATDFETTYRDRRELARAREIAGERRRRAEQALGIWLEEVRREVTPQSTGRQDPLLERVEADFDLLGWQLMKVRFHWGEVLAALDGIVPAVFDGERRVHLVPVPLARGVTAVRRDARIEDGARAASYMDVMGSGRRLVNKYHGTPWALFVQRGVVFTLTVRIEEPRPPDPRPEPAPPVKPMPAPPPVPPRPPPPPIRPGSAGGGPTTNK